MRRVLVPCWVSVVMRWSSVWLSPAMMVDCGPLIAAIVIPSGRVVSRCSAGAATEAMPPWPASFSAIAWLRATTMRAASSRFSIPATCAAAISPWECPMTASGWTPQDCQSCARATITTKETGCTTSTRSSEVSAIPRAVSITGQGTSFCTSAAVWVRAWANTGEDVHRSAAIPAHWAPWPGNTNTTRVSTSATPVTVFPAGASVATAVRPSNSSWWSVPITTARWVSAARPRARDSPTSPALTSVSVSCRKVASRVAWPCRPAVVAPDNTQATAPGSPVKTGTVATGWLLVLVVGGCSRMMWALVPLTPKEDTAARRGRFTCGQGCVWLSSCTAPADQSIFVEGWSAWSVLGSVPWCRAITILMTPAMPAAAWAWPMLDLRDPSHSGSVSGSRCP